MQTVPIDDIFVNYEVRSAVLRSLKSLGLLIKNGNKIIPSNAGIILLANEEVRFYKFNNVRVSCARFAGDTKAEFIARIDIEGGILVAVNEVLKFIRRNIRMAAEIKEIRRGIFLSIRPRLFAKLYLMRFYIPIIQLRV